MRSAAAVVALTLCAYVGGRDSGAVMPAGELTAAASTQRSHIHRADIIDEIIEIINTIINPPGDTKP